MTMTNSCSQHMNQPAHINKQAPRENEDPPLEADTPALPHDKINACITKHVSMA